ncbi:unnamed protein product [Amoebophrya sp. A120]|nr:unnamed protein product [Amoebophrya sp. A120]|eukprot:GSA120T00007856001.1
MACNQINTKTGKLTDPDKDYSVSEWRPPDNMLSQKLGFGPDGLEEFWKGNAGDLLRLVWESTEAQEAGAVRISSYNCGNRTPQPVADENGSTAVSYCKEGQLQRQDRCDCPGAAARCSKDAPDGQLFCFKRDDNWAGCLNYWDCLEFDYTSYTYTGRKITYPLNDGVYWDCSKLSGASSSFLQRDDAGLPAPGPTPDQNDGREQKTDARDENDGASTSTSTQQEELVDTKNHKAVLLV